MKMIKNKTDSLYRDVKAEGLFDAHLTYKVASFDGELTYNGPKIPREMWGQILSYFKWTYDTFKGESQVRLYVSPKLGQWKAWAYPQKPSIGGLHTEEVDNEEAKKQRAQLFENDDDWIAWGTVHHHCNVSAFQSGTDRDNEEVQDGLHITVGDLDKEKYSIHSRLYHKGDMFEPKYKELWAIGDSIKDVPAWVIAMLSGDIEEQVAMKQMCTPSSAEFPAEWKANIIKEEPRGIVKVPHDWRTEHNNVGGNGKGKKHKHTKTPTPTDSSALSPSQRADLAIEEIDEIIMFSRVEEHEIQPILDLMSDYPQEDIVLICAKYKVSPADLLRAWEYRASKEKEQQQTNGQDSFQYGMD